MIFERFANSTEAFSLLKITDEMEFNIQILLRQRLTRP